MIQKIRNYIKNRSFLIGFLPIFGLGGLMISPLPQVFHLEEKPSLGLVVPPSTYGGDIRNNVKKENSSIVSDLAIEQDSALIASEAVTPAVQPKIMVIALTAYSSHRDETDDTPFLTASGTKTRDGVIAANFLPFGTVVRIPELFGDKTFVVEDRMRRKFSRRIDIWMPSKKEAILFGKVTSRIEIVNQTKDILQNNLSAAISEF